MRFSITIYKGYWFFMEDQKQIDLSVFIKKDAVENYCHVVINGKSVDKTYSDLFDYDKYNQMYAATYVSSPQFFSKIVESFEKVQIVLGIDKEEVNEAFAEGTSEIILNKGVEFFKSMNKRAKDMVVENNLDIRYADVGNIIHSKLYLLDNDRTGAKRVIIGSANLTESAFSNKISQYEEVLVFDDNEIYETYLRRFRILQHKAVDYIPKKIIKQYKDEQVIFVDNEEKLDLIIDRLTEKNAKLLITDELITSIDKANSKHESKQAEYKITTQILSQSTKIKNKKLVLKSSSELNKLKPNIKNLVFKTTKPAEELNRFCLNYNRSEKRIYKIVQDDDFAKKAISFDEECNKEEIKQTLIIIEKFIEAYKRFTIENGDNTNLSKVFEVILYSFISAFIFMIREQYGINVGKVEKREEVPIFMIIGGRAYAGKSNLLSFVSKLLSGEQANHYLHYKDINKANVIESLFYEENIFPIFVDEVEPKFFKSKANSKGEALIKNLANSLDSIHPTLICTTNTKTFDVPAQVLRRVYYIQIDKTFDDMKKNEADLYYIKIMDSINNKLFKDFCYRVSNRLKEGELLYYDSVDWLKLARNIFKEYYSEVERELPSYFPENPFDDYKERGRIMWRTLFNEKPDIFTYSFEKDELVVNFENMDIDSRSSYLNYLLNGCIKEDSGLFLLVNAKIFFDWIKVDNPFKVKGLRRIIMSIRNGIKNKQKIRVQ